MGAFFTFNLILVFSFLAAGPAFASPQEIDPSKFSVISRTVEDAVRNGQTPGAVVVIGNRGRVVFRQGFGHRATGPGKAEMTEDTIFDIASLTKVVATTPAVLQLEERGKLRLDDPVVKHWPAFKGNHKEKITIRHLLTHYSGLPAGLRMKPKWSGTQDALQRVCKEKTNSPPGSTFLYSDINFIILAELVHRISGKPFDVYCRENIYQPLGMKDTMFKPPRSLVSRIAPTFAESPGTVHDGVAARMGGIAGHAGVFSTADDLASLAQAILDGGALGEARILTTKTVENMVLPHSPPDRMPLRGLGWSIHSPSGSQMSELLPPDSFGHKGFTGTLIWIDPVTRTYLIVLSNRVYPGEKETGETLRDQVLYRLAEALGRTPVLTDPALIAKVSPQLPGPAAVPVAQVQRRPVKPGIDVLSEHRFLPLVNKRVGLITNHTGIDSGGRRTIDLVHKAGKVKLKAVFAPEHGLTGKLDRKIQDGRDPKFKIPVYSLYGQTLRPTPKMLKGIDVLVFDIQDAGVRFYTYISTMGMAMEAAAKKKIPFIVLDRPNPITASMVQGPVMDADLKSFTGYFPLPIRHGMTVGEIAMMFNSEMGLGAKLQVIKMHNYRRSDWFDETGLTWVNPSPNLRSVTQAALYPAVALVEGSNLSVGRGTDTPFEIFGAPWIKAKDLSDTLGGRKIPGVEFQPATFVPAGFIYGGKTCEGVKITLVDRNSLDAALLGIEIVSALYRLYPNDFLVDKTLSMIGSRRVLQSLKEGRAPQTIALEWQQDLERFAQVRSKYLLYSD